GDELRECAEGEEPRAGSACNGGARGEAASGHEAARATTQGRGCAGFVNRETARRGASAVEAGADAGIARADAEVGELRAADEWRSVARRNARSCPDAAEDA